MRTYSMSVMAITLLGFIAQAHSATINGGDDSTSQSSVSTPVAISPNTSGGGGGVVGVSNFKSSYAGKTLAFNYGDTAIACGSYGNITRIGPRGSATVSSDGSTAYLNVVSTSNNFYYLRGTLSADPSSLSYVGTFYSNRTGNTNVRMTLTGGSAELTGRAGSICQSQWYGFGYLQ